MAEREFSNWGKYVSEFEKYVSADETAEYLTKECGFPVSPKTLGEWARTRQCPSYKVNGRRRFRLSEMRAWSVERTQRSEAAPR